jgi:sec-independent protein translocase protein TatA
MESSSLTPWLVVLAVVLIVFGAGRLPKAMGELARGVRTFRSGMRDEAATDIAGVQLAAAPPAEATGDLP